MQIRKVIIVFKTHFDIGFTQLSRDILDYYAGDMLDRVAETCDATKDMGDLRYVWTMPSWPLKEMRARCDGRRAALVDDLIELTGIPTRRVLSALTMLELDKLVRQHSGKRYTRAVTLLE